MNLVRFLFFITLLSALVGEFGKFPFGASGGAVSITDILIVLDWSVVLIWIVNTKRTVKIPPLFWFMIIFFVLSGVSLVFSAGKFGVFESLKGSLYLARFILYASTLLLTYNIYSFKNITVAGYWQIIGRLGFYFTIFGFLQLLIVPNFDKPPLFLTQYGYDPHEGRLTSTFLDPNFAGIYLVFIFTSSIFYKLREKADRQFLLFLGLLVVGIYLTYSRSAYLFLGISFLGVLFILWNKVNLFKKIVMFCVVICVASLLLTLSPKFASRISGAISIDKSAAERFVSWSNGIKVFEKNPIIGVGFDNLRIAQNKMDLFKTYSANGGHAGGGVDSSILFVLATTGILGLILYLLFWGSVIRFFLKTPFQMKIYGLILILGVFVSSEFLNALFYPPIMLLIYSELGVIIAELESA